MSTLPSGHLQKVPGAMCLCQHLGSFRFAGRLGADILDSFPHGFLAGLHRLNALFQALHAGQDGALGSCRLERSPGVVLSRCRRL